MGLPASNDKRKKQNDKLAVRGRKVAIYKRDNGNTIGTPGSRVSTEIRVCMIDI